MEFDELKHAVESIAGHHGWEYEGLDGEWYWRFEKGEGNKKVMVDVYYNKKILKGAFPGVPINISIKKQLSKPVARKVFTLTALEKVFIDEAK